MITTRTMFLQSVETVYQMHLDTSNNGGRYDAPQQYDVVAEKLDPKANKKQTTTTTTTTTTTKSNDCNRPAAVFKFTFAT